ncbi:MAG: ABC transporter ATP-binding protein [Clostridia bacterium]|nr:ABC transporter ATP-binding protein [Clostridia bacterium]MBQ8772627.1 ABC transporter ATP-binding protein [Clostridia bacterium]
MKILQLKNVSKAFYTKTQETLAIKDLSLTVNKGEFVSIIGPSGCGKTTVLSLIAGLIAPTSGTVWHNTQGIGYMLQRDHLFEWRTIWKNVTLGLEINKTKTAANCQYVENLLKKYGLWEFAKHYPPQLSGGMRQRAALIRTLATNPDLLLLDEPFSALDFQTRLAVCDDVYKIIRSENKTAVLVTHDISEAISMSDRILVLSSRPSSVILVHETGLSDIDTPLKRRESAQFAPQFEMLYNLLNSQKGANYG